MTELREKIARAIWEAPLLGQPKGFARRVWPPSYDDTRKEMFNQADAVLAISEIADALRACDDGGELDVYRANCEFPD